ncbi:hypothetical protein Busp01_25730 [Trinickia caryophylli]|uniref:DUF6883 domain-containing protein n=1 Tax=Trinickia caryophylli TaxID=28094 RepID=UPI0024A51F6E|nr:DUF6883 domain-containing protein [Trinickia caryophylli]GLU32731.1 hypothetical protein Busp01_25730 [Trinickia caryophylli]
MSAAFSPDFIKAIDPTGAPLSAGQQAALAGFATLLGGVTAGLAGLDAQAGALAAQNEALNNSGDHPADAAKKGGLLSAFGNWLQNTYGDPLGDLSRWGNQFMGLVKANNGQTPPSDPNPLVQANNGNPPNTGAAPVTPAVPVCEPPVCTILPAAPGAPGKTPSNALLSSGNSGSEPGNTTSQQGSTTNGNLGFDTSNIESKLNGYLLDPAHPQNQTKANWFSQALGFDQSNWQALASQLYFDPESAVLTKTTQYGQTYEQVIPITGTNGKTINTTFVFIKDNTGTVRLVTGIPAKK